MYAVVGCGTAFHIYTTSQSYFYMDDFPYLTRVTDVNFWSAVSAPYNDHLMPLQFAVVWVTQQVSAMSWVAAVIVTASLWFVFLLGAMKALGVIFGERYLSLAPMALLAFSPLLTQVTLWYASALQALSWAACFVWFLYFAYRYAYGSGRKRDAVFAIVVLLIGLLAWQKSLSILPVALLLLVVARPLNRSNLSAFWIRCHGFLIAATTLAVAYSLVYLVSTGTSQLRESPSVADLIESFRRMIGTVLIPSLFGVDSSSYNVTGLSSDALDPWLVALFWFLAFLVCVIAIYHRPATLLIWTMLFGYSIASVVFFAYARLGPFGIGLSSDARYVEDLFVIAVFALCFALVPATGSPLATRDTPWPAFVGNRFVFPGVGVIAVAVMAVGSLNLTATWSDLRAQEPRDYVANARQQLPLASGNAVFDDLVPEGVLSGIFLEEARQSALFKGLKIPVNWDGPAAGMGHLTSEAILAPIRIGTAASSVNAQVVGCGWPVRDAPTSIPLSGELFPWVWVVRVQYLSQSDGLARIGFSAPGSSRVTLPIEEGLNDTWLVLTGGGGSLEMQALDDFGMCVDKVTLGEPE